MASDGQRTRREIGWEVAGAVVGFLLGFGLTQPIFCVTGVNGAAHTECQNLLLMTFSGPYRVFVGFAGGIAGAIILGWASP